MDGAVRGVARRERLPAAQVAQPFPPSTRRAPISQRGDRVAGEALFRSRRVCLDYTAAVPFVAMLIIMAGLPGTGKTTIPRGLARQLGAVHVGIDSIEQGP